MNRNESSGGMSFVNSEALCRFPYSVFNRQKPLLSANHSITTNAHSLRVFRSKPTVHSDRSTTSPIRRCTVDFERNDDFETACRDVMVRDPGH